MTATWGDLTREELEARASQMQSVIAMMSEYATYCAGVVLGVSAVLNAPEAQDPVALLPILRDKMKTPASIASGWSQKHSAAIDAQLKDYNGVGYDASDMTLGTSLWEFAL